jgi:Peptidase family M28
MYTYNIILRMTKEQDYKIQTDIILDEINSTKLKEWIDTLSSFPTRHTESHYIENVANWLKSEFENVCKGSRVFFHNYTQRDQNLTFNLKNIICSSKEGLAPSSPSSYHNNTIIIGNPLRPRYHHGFQASYHNNTIIIGAHYDSRAENINNTYARAPGADDNASGVSAVLELSRILSHLNLNYNLQFVLFSGEEQYGEWGGEWGSTNYVKYLDNNNQTKDIDLYINLDMIGYTPPNETKNKVILIYDVGNKYVKNDKYSKNIALFVKKIASNYTDLEVELAEFDNTDLASFEAFNHTVIGIYDGGVEKNPHYHKSTDTPDTLNIKYLTSITKMVLATILELDRLSQYLK